MDKLVIADLIEEKYQELFDWLNQQPGENWEQGPEGNGQQVNIFYIL